MDTYQHRVSGFFVKWEEANTAYQELVRRGIPEHQLALYANDHVYLKPSASANSNDTLKSMLVDGAIGTAVGTAVGALGEIALVASSVTLFVASPLIGPLSMLGWGASLGAVIGAVVGSTRIHKEGSKLSELVADAIQGGQVVLVTTAYSEYENSIAIEVIQMAVRCHVRPISSNVRWRTYASRYKTNNALA
jgi:hypothetical protein